MIPSPILQALQQKTEFDIYSNPYKAKRLWPPDFSKLSPKYQFRLERRYKRRLKLKWARPRWTKIVKLAQLGSIASILAYSVFFVDWKRENEPFQGIREEFYTMVDSIWRGPPEGVQRRQQSKDAPPVSNTK